MARRRLILRGCYASCNRDREATPRRHRGDEPPRALRPPGVHRQPPARSGGRRADQRRRATAGGGPPQDAGGAWAGDEDAVARKTDTPQGSRKGRRYDRREKIFVPGHLALSPITRALPGGSDQPARAARSVGRRQQKARLHDRRPRPWRPQRLASLADTVTPKRSRADRLRAFRAGFLALF